MLAWTWRGLAALAILGSALILWSPWHHRPAAVDRGSSAAQAQAQSPAAKPAEAPSPPAAAPTTPGEAPTGAAEEAWKGLTIEISFEAETWIQVYADGALRVGGLFPAGASARAHADEKLLIHTGNAGGFTFKLNGRQAKPLGRSGAVLTGIKITPENLKDFLEDPSSPRPAG
jgi:cytoskeleton protein RodZ